MLNNKPNILPSYKTADCCKDKDCDWLDATSTEPCYGQVTVVDEIYTEDDCWWVHACEGHAGVTDGEKYKISTYPEDN